MEAYKYIMDCPKCNHHLLFNESDVTIEKDLAGYACEMYTKRKSALNRHYYLRFNNLEELIEIINNKGSDEIICILNVIKFIQFVECPNCKEKIILNSVLFAEDIVGSIDLYDYKKYYPKLGETKDQFIIRLLNEIKH